MQYTARYNIQYDGRWIALRNSVLRIGIAVKCVHAVFLAVVNVKFG